MPVGLQPVEVPAQQAEVEHAGEAEQREAEHIHLVVHRAGREDQAGQAECGHHKANDEVAWLEVHGTLRKGFPANCRAAVNGSLIWINVGSRATGETRVWPLAWRS